MGVLEMINDNSLAGLFYLFSILLTVIGFILGVVFMMTQLPQGIIMIMVAGAGGGLLFGIGKVLQLLTDIKTSANILFENQVKEETKVTYSKEEIVSNKEEVAVSKESDMQEPAYNVPVEWSLTNKQRSNIIAYYLKDKQKVLDKDIIVSPYKGYCVVKTNRFVDVIEMVDDNPITLKRDQVENFKELRNWIEENVFRKKK